LWSFPQKVRQGGFDYLFDPARSDSILARKETDDALQRAAGRQDTFVAKDREFKEPGAVTSTS
jgi:hypothetical protein